MRNWWISVLTVVFGLPALPQEADPRLRFEVASIRQCVDTERHPAPASSPGRLSMACWPLLRLIQDAYDLFASGKVDPLNPGFPLTPVEGYPDSLRLDRYSIDARAETPQAVAMMRGPMMQRLLEERFHLKTHVETREVPVYIMTVAKDGPKLQPMKEGDCQHLDSTDLTQSLKIEPGGKPWCVITTPVKNGATFVWDVNGMSLGVMSKLLKIGGVPVIDRTGVAGAFNIHLEWTPNTADPPSPDSPAASPPPDTSMIPALRKQLGLQLTPGKGPREFLVIDHVERPSGN